MNARVSGAVGRTGRAAVEQAIAVGHEVTAFVREANPCKDPNVRGIEGDANNRVHGAERRAPPRGDADDR